MASRAINKAPPADWRAAFRASLRRASQLSGAVLLFAAMLFLAIALATYHQTDPSPSTAAGDEVANWMGRPGAWAAERTLLLFGPVAVLLLPLLYAFANKLWRDAADEESLAPGKWWRSTLKLLFGMVLLCTVLQLTFGGPGGVLPASIGGFTGLLGARGVEALAALLPEGTEGWGVLGLALVCLVGGITLAARVFAFDWGRLFTLPALKRAPRLAEDLPFLPGAARLRKVGELPPEVAEAEPRKPTEITDPTRPPRPARAASASKQGDMFADYTLPSLDLLNDPPAHAQAKIDKLALERNARLLENVLDDFNVKGGGIL